MVKSFGAEDFESNRFRVASKNLKAGNLKYVAQQALPSPIIEFFGAVTIVALPVVRPSADQERAT